MLALRIVPAPHSQRWREAIAASGMMGILASIFVMTANTPFPGENALLPCVSTGAIILMGEEGRSTLIGRALSQRPVVFVGLISYSLYLWHWPLLIFSRIAVFKSFDIPATNGTNLLLVLISTAIAVGSWRYIESPFRTGPYRPSKRAIFIFGATCIPICVSAAWILSSARGLTGRFSTSANAVANYLDYKESHPLELRAVFGSGSCYLDRREAVANFNEQGCLKPGPGKRQVLIFGDSHAANLRHGLELSIPNVHFLQATSSSCPPTLKQNRNSTVECKQFVNKVLNEYIPERSISVVLLAAYWTSADLENLTDTIELLHQRGIAVILFGPFPVYDMDLPRLLAKSITNGKIDYARRHLVPQERALDEQMSGLAKSIWHVPYVSPLESLCTDVGCDEYAVPDLPMQFDTSHFTLQGSEYLGRRVRIDYPHLFESQ